MKLREKELWIMYVKPHASMCELYNYVEKYFSTEVRERNWKFENFSYRFDPWFVEFGGVV